MKSSLPRPFVNLAKKIIIPILRNKWKKNPIVIEWIKKGFINDGEIDWLVLNWQKHGTPIPPPPKVKQLMVEAMGKKYNCKALVETGTYKGDMIFSQLNNFEELYSIELSEDFYNNAKIRFSKNLHVNLIQGDSGVELPKLTPQLTKKTLFWLDGHYCGGETAQSEVECPIYKELQAILDQNIEHMILIDDARMFNGTRDYPTLEELEKYVFEKFPGFQLKVENDVIVIDPKNI
ncbi:MAG: hypothetical protein RLZZ546_2259 [Bacteroidota bacterium]|jgi:hypothetical protein